MAERQAACPRCGDPVDREGPLCDACYLEQFDLLDAPDEVRIGVCTQCGSVEVDEWADLGDREYGDVAIEAVTDALAVHVEATDIAWTVDVEQADRNALTVTASFEGTVRGQRLDEQETVPVRLDRVTCPRCGRIAGDDHDAIVQIRAADRAPTKTEREDAIDLAREVVAGRIDDGDREAFVTDIERTDDGANLKVSTASIAAIIANRIVDTFGGTRSRSRRLIGESDGKHVYRTTETVRLPAFREGDIVSPDDGDGPVLIESAGGPTGLRLDTGDERSVDPEAAERVGHVEDAVETTLVAVEDANAVQVLDPESFEAVTVSRPSYLTPDEDSVLVIRVRDGLFILPSMTASSHEDPAQ
jgi:nonsense-mediated mRNA decay protein 3